MVSREGRQVVVRTSSKLSPLGTYCHSGFGSQRLNHESGQVSPLRDMPVHKQCLTCGNPLTGAGRHVLLKQRCLFYCSIWMRMELQPLLSCSVIFIALYESSQLKQSLVEILGLRRKKCNDSRSQRLFTVHTPWFLGRWHPPAPPPPLPCRAPCPRTAQARLQIPPSWDVPHSCVLIPPPQAAFRNMCFRKDEEKKTEFFFFNPKLKL